MWRPNYSNCNIWAWEAFRRGQVSTMVLHKTHYSRWRDLARSRLWQGLLTPIGYLIGYLAWALVQAAWFLMFGSWAHVTAGGHEYVPRAAKRPHWVPPLIFRGVVRPVAGDDPLSPPS